MLFRRTLSDWNLLNRVIFCKTVCFWDCSEDYGFYFWIFFWNHPFQRQLTWYCGVVSSIWPYKHWFFTSFFFKMHFLDTAIYAKNFRIWEPYEMAIHTVKNELIVYSNTVEVPLLELLQFQTKSGVLNQLLDVKGQKQWLFVLQFRWIRFSFVFIICQAVLSLKLKFICSQRNRNFGRKSVFLLCHISIFYFIFLFFLLFWQKQRLNIL